MNIKASFSRFLLLILLLSLLLSGCGQVAGVRTTPTSTEVPATSTPEPTLTFTPLPSPTETSTPTVRPTRTPAPTRDYTATAVVAQTLEAEVVNMLLQPDLEKYGVDPSAGRLVWLQTSPVRLELSNYLENQNRVLSEVGSQTDFVIQSRITWDTSGALSLCGITFRAEDDLELGAQNRFFMMRLQFAPMWTIWRWEYGKFQSFVPGDWVSSRNIHDKNGKANLVALVVRGKDIDVYINHDKQLRVEDSKRESGLLALSAHQESGQTKCKFENTWVWAFDK